MEIPPSDPLDIDYEAPNLMVIKEAIKSLKTKRFLNLIIYQVIYRCPIGKHKCLGDLDFSDDIALTTSNRSQMQRRTNLIAKTSKKVGLEINVQKTKILRINAKSKIKYLRMSLALSILEVNLMKLEAL